MKVKDNFFNNLAAELDKTYFPNVKFYRDDANCTKMHYVVELFNNGCLIYDKFIKKLSLCCNDSLLNIHNIVSRFIDDFEGYEYKC